MAWTLADKLDARLTAPTFVEDPYPVYAAMREEDPVHWCAPWGVWVLTRYADCHAVIRDPRLFSNAGRFSRLLEQLPAEVQPQVEPMKRHNMFGLTGSDPPAHTRLRRLLQQSFTPALVEGMRDRVTQLCDELIDRFPPHRCEFLSSLAFSLPIHVICEMMGLPQNDHEHISRMSIGVSGLQARGGAELELALHASASIVEMEDYFKAFCAERRANPRKDLISLMARAEAEGERLSADEMISLCITLVIAGHETTKSLISSGLLTLARHPDQLEDLRRNPELIESTVEECLRFESPIQRAFRRVTEDTEFQGHTFRKDQLVFLMIGGANRDPEFFPDPNRFDIRRENNKHLGFGAGIHFCLGAPLSRLEAAIAFERLLKRLPNLSVVESGGWNNNIHIRTLKSLQIQY